MNTRPLVLLGGGGNARVCVDTARAIGLRNIMIATATALEVRIDDVEVFVGSDSEIITRIGTSADYLIAVGDLATRRRIQALLDGAGVSLCSALIHPTAIVSPNATIDAGTVIFPGAIVNANARIARNVIVNSGAIIEHDCTLGEGVHVAPGAVLAGGVKVGAWAFVGANATILPGTTIGDDAIIGAGAVVTSHVAPNAVMVGSPARQIK